MLFSLWSVNTVWLYMLLYLGSSGRIPVNLRHATLNGFLMICHVFFRNGAGVSIAKQADFALRKGELKTCLDHSIVDGGG